MEEFFGGLVVYFLPTFAALFYGSKRIVSISLINVFLGWTIIFWFVAGWMAVQDALEKEKEKIKEEDLEKEKIKEEVENG